MKQLINKSIIIKKYCEEQSITRTTSLPRTNFMASNDDLFSGLNRKWTAFWVTLPYISEKWIPTTSRYIGYIYRAAQSTIWYFCILQNLLVMATF